METGDVKTVSRRAGAPSRVFAFGALAAITACLGWAGHEGYLAATDSFVAPVILAPDNDQVLATKLHAAQLGVERARAASEIEAADEAIAAANKAIDRLKSIQRTPEAALAWSTTVNAHQVSAGYTEGRMLLAQRQRRSRSSRMTARDSRPGSSCSSSRSRTSRWRARGRRRRS